MECIEKIIKKDMIDPINSKKLTDKDIIPLQRVCNVVMTVYTTKLTYLYIMFVHINTYHLEISPSRQAIFNRIRVQCL